ncbi:MAG: hypothetical protein P4L84_04620 [Isosphaeraceae bacterium]|nr:hypothetical protein [Isosphaeraceae bacterium]
MILKLLALGATSALGVALAGYFPPPEKREGDPPPPAKKKGGPAGDLRKAYDGLLRIRAWNRPSGRPEERLRDWTERATKFYRDGVKAQEAGDERLAHEYGAIAAELTRAVDHARNAALTDALDSDLPPPPPGPGPEGDDSERVRRDLGRVYDRLGALRDENTGRDGKFCHEAARDLYNAARRDAEAGRTERAGELARAADAMSHALEHLGHLEDRAPEAKGERPEPKKKGERPDPKKERRDDALPPPLDF